MGRNRSQAVVVRGERILMVKHFMFGREFFCLPGGGIEQGETPQQAALRELFEEANVNGVIVQEISVQYKSEDGGEVHSFLIEIPETAVPTKGIDPEMSLEEQTITGVAWMKLEELSELDKIYLWSAGLLRVPVFYEKIKEIKKSL